LCVAAGHDRLHGDGSDLLEDLLGSAFAAFERQRPGGLGLFASHAAKNLFLAGLPVRQEAVDDQHHADHYQADEHYDLCHGITP